MTAAVDAAVRVLVAGTTGGAGTTTVAAMVFDGLRTATAGAPVLYDHSGGDIGERLPNGDEVRHIDDRIALQDLGPHALRVAARTLERRHDVLVAVAPGPPFGLLDARTLLETVRAAHGVGGLRRALLVLNAPFGPWNDPRAVEALRADFERLNVLVLPRDAALAAGGRIALPRLAAGTRRAQHVLARRAADLVGRHRGGTGA